MFVVGFFEPTGLHLLGEDSTVAIPLRLLHLGGFGFFTITNVGWSDLFSAVGFEATIFEDLAVYDTTAMFVPTVGADNFYFVVELGIQLDQEVALAFAAVEFLEDSGHSLAFGKLLESSSQVINIDWDYFGGDGEG